jgi:uncharacterized phage protein (TIGR02220 family)
MARMSIDDMFLRDPRVVLLARRLGISKYDARGRILEVFGLIYDRVDDVLAADVIDVATEIEGFAAHMIAVDLAEQTRRGIRIKGAEERIEYLRKKQLAAIEGGRKSGESRRNNSKHPVNHELNHGAKHQFTEREASANPPDPVPALVPVPASPPDPVPDPVRSEKNSAAPSAGGSRSRKPKPSEPTEQERTTAMSVLEKLSARNGVRYSGARDHVQSIVGRLRDGLTEMDLRKVIAYCAVELKWAEKPDMAPYLRPETLFGPKTIAKYLDPARAWFEKLPPERQPQGAAS